MRRHRGTTMHHHKGTKVSHDDRPNQRESVRNNQGITPTTINATWAGWLAAIAVADVSPAHVFRCTLIYGRLQAGRTMFMDTRG